MHEFRYGVQDATLLLTELILWWNHNTSCSLYWTNIEVFVEISKITAFGKNHGKRRKSRKSRLPWLRDFLLFLAIFRRTAPSLTGASNACESTYDKNRNFRPKLFFHLFFLSQTARPIKNKHISLHRVFSTAQPLGVVKGLPPNLLKLVTVVAGSSKRRRLLIAEVGRRSDMHQQILFMTGSLGITPKRTEQNLVLRIDKSEAGGSIHNKCIGYDTKGAASQSPNYICKPKTTFYRTPVCVLLPKFYEKLLPRAKFHWNRAIVCWVMARKQLLKRQTTISLDFNKNLAIANRSRVSCAHNTLRASIRLNITP